MKKKFDFRKHKVKSLFKWLYPGIGIKRWIGLSAFGVILVILGSSDLRSDDFWPLEMLDAGVLISGIIILTSMDDRERLNKGKNLLKWTLVGLAIALSSSFIIGLLNELLGLNL